MIINSETLQYYNLKQGCTIKKKNNISHYLQNKSCLFSDSTIFKLMFETHIHQTNKLVTCKSLSKALTSVYMVSLNLFSEIDTPYGSLVQNGAWLSLITSINTAQSSLLSLKPRWSDDLIVSC